MAEMPRPRPPHLHRQVTRHGKTVWYVRVGKGKRIRLRSEFGSPDFNGEYQAALTGMRAPKRADPTEGTLAWLVDRYRTSSAWTELSLATRRQRENILMHVLESAGREAASKITTATVIEGRERRAETPAQARNFLDAMRGLFRWALKANLLKADPTIGVRQSAAS